MKYIQFSKPEINLTEVDIRNIKKSLNSGWFCNGEYVQELEKHFRDEFNVKYAVSCANCTSGLIVAFKALNIKNNIVAMPAFTWPSTEYAANCNGNTILWCDINLDTWDVETLRKNRKWDCQVSVDIFGNESYLPKEYAEYTIYDAAHGYGLENLGNRGDIEVVSMSFTKPVTSSQGGMILFNDDNLYENVRELVNLSCKLTEVNAYVGLSSIKSYKERKKVRAEIRQAYREYLEVTYKEQVVKRCSNYSTFSILLNSKEKRDAVARAFKENNIEVKTYYEPLFRELKNTEIVYSRIISLPVYEEMASEVKRICKLINGA